MNSGDALPRDRWTFVDSGARSGAEQMAIDSALLDQAASSSGDSRPVFRIYSWRPPAVSLGFHQAPDRELDLSAVAARGYDVVRRPTGGRAILHVDELTYAIVTRIDDPLVGGSIRESHAAISRIFRDALRRLGVPAEMAGEGGAGGQPGAGDPLLPASGGGSGVRLRPGGGLTSPPCFATALGTELVVRGRKILGSAQRRRGGAFLQHGSLLLGPGHLELANLLLLPPEGRATWRTKLEATTTDLSREAGRRVTSEEVAAALAEALSGLFGSAVRFAPAPARL